MSQRGQWLGWVAWTRGGGAEGVVVPRVEMTDPPRRADRRWYGGWTCDDRVQGGRKECGYPSGARCRRGISCAGEQALRLAGRRVGRQRASVRGTAQARPVQIEYVEHDEGSHRDTGERECRPPSHSLQTRYDRPPRHFAMVSFCHVGMLKPVARPVNAGGRTQISG